MFNTNKKIKNIKTIDDIFKAIDQLKDYMNTMPHDQDMIVGYELYTAKQKTKDKNIIFYEREENKILFNHGIKSYRDYLVTEAEIDRKERYNALHETTSGKINESLTKEFDSIRDVRLNEIDFICGSKSYHEYLSTKNTLEQNAYSEIYISQDVNNDSEISCTFNFNDIFIDIIKKNPNLEKSYIVDDEGKSVLDTAHLTEQWMRSLIVLFAANLLKEEDLDIFRSVSDVESSDLVENFQFENEEDRAKAEKFLKNRTIHR